MGERVGAVVVVLVILGMIAGSWLVLWDTGPWFPFPGP